jgi:hypothetical protein
MSKSPVNQRILVSGDDTVSIEHRFPTHRQDPLRAWRKLFPPNPHIKLYAIQQGEDGPVKIGVAQKPWERLATLQTASPVRLRGVAAWSGSIAEEKALHELFAEDRLEGEWFKPSEELLALVEWLGFPTCEFAKPANCLSYRSLELNVEMRGTCESCGIQFGLELEAA